MCRQYEEAAEANGVTPRTVVLRELWLADSDAEAKATYGPVVEPVFRYYLKKGALGHLPDLTAEDVTLDRALRDIVVCGSVDTVAARITELLERTRAEACVFMLRHPHGPSHDRVCDVITRLGTELWPRIQRRDRVGVLGDG
jgi:alkanesulfonate monooxygenase SsuD/methylene tetrahydromethanopterin reductase-like flavin-dependent oxidoreductase (luciferase family)